MKIRTTTLIFLILSILISAQSQDAKSQNKNDGVIVKTLKIDKGNASFIVKGTSTLHDWEMVSKNFDGNVQFTTQNKNLIINSINIKIAVTSLESGKKLMNKLSYEALKYEKYPTISYQFKDIKEIKLTAENVYTAILNGTLTVAGKSKSISTAVDISLKDNNLNISTLNIKGEEPLKMSDFDMTPPTALFGTIKTKDEITIEFNLNYI